MIQEFTFTKDKDYKVVVERSNRRTIRFDFRNGYFKIKAAKTTSNEVIVKYLNKYFDRLVTNNPHVAGIGEDFIYIFGDKYSISESGALNIKGEYEIKYTSKEDLLKKLKKYFQKILKMRTEYYEEQMKLCENEVKVREMVSRYGSNSIDKKSITYNFILIHYNFKIIDAVIIHELTHCLIHGHDKSFYKKLLQYCPDYKRLHKCLVGGCFNG